jgi:hypothetical protein
VANLLAKATGYAMQIFNDLHFSLFNFRNALSLTYLDASLLA